MTRRFSPQFIDDVRSRTSLVALIGASVALRKEGSEYTGLCPFHHEKTGSFKVVEAKGFWHCHGCGVHGDAIEWLRRHGGLSFTEAVEELAVRAGMQPDREGRKRPEVKPVARPAAEDLERERAGRIGWARGVWAECRPAAGTPVETYLRSRGITLPPPPSLRFHPGLKHRDTGMVLPAMVGAVQDGQGRIAGIHRTFLRGDGRGKAPVARGAKMMAGVCQSGAVRLVAAAETLGIAEGIETALSVAQAAGLPMWAALSLGNLAAVTLPEAVRAVVLCADADNRDPDKAEAALVKAAETHRAAGRAVRIARPPAGMDFNAWLQALRARRAA